MKIEQWFKKKNLLPMFVQIIIDFSVRNCQHDDEDSEKHHRDKKLVDCPHRDCSRLQVTEKKGEKKIVKKLYLFFFYVFKTQSFLYTHFLK